MSFGSTTFLAFLLAVVVAYYAVPVRALGGAAHDGHGTVDGDATAVLSMQTYCTHLRLTN